MMPPCRSNRRVNNTSTPLPPPPPQMDIVIFQVVVTVVVAAAMAQINTNVTNGTGGGTNYTNQGDSQGQPRECSYKEFSNYKPKSFNGSRGVIALTR